MKRFNEGFFDGLRMVAFGRRPLAGALGYLAGRSLMWALLFLPVALAVAAVLMYSAA
jgi:hypothetical protein